MSNDQKPPLFTNDTKLEVGDAAVILKEGGVSIVHNIPYVHETGQITAGEGCGAMMQALAIRELFNDEAMFTTLMRRVASKLATGTVALN